ncbi:hypothetical protein IQ07DRAFT_593088 [Pyrenochaeta sp. DS3sAY3a]|nr:hypothetical protein IQ07DRAFT_593088 [Pyrenochaeta sp. DS3sAY3a]
MKSESENAYTLNVHERCGRCKLQVDLPNYSSVRRASLRHVGWSVQFSNVGLEYLEIPGKKGRRR